VSLMASGAGQLRVEIFEVDYGSCFGFACAAEEAGFRSAEAGMVQEQTRKFAASVAADACDGDSGGGCSRLGLFEYVCRC